MCSYQCCCPAALLQAALARLGLNGDTWVHIEAAESHTASSHIQNGTGISSSSSRTVCEAPIRAVLQGVLDLSGGSPRRYLFQILSQFTTHELHRERLKHFATAEGRDDLYRWVHRQHMHTGRWAARDASPGCPGHQVLAKTPMGACDCWRYSTVYSVHGMRCVAAMRSGRVNLHTSAWQHTRYRPSCNVQL